MSLPNQTHQQHNALLSNRSPAGGDLQVDIAHKTVTVTPRVSVLDAAEVPAFIRDMRAMAEEYAGMKVVLDLTNVEFVDSTGISGLIHTLKAILSHHGSLILTRINPAVRDLLDLTGMSRVFDIDATATPVLQ